MNNEQIAEEAKALLSGEYADKSELEKFNDKEGDIHYRFILKATHLHGIEKKLKEIEQMFDRHKMGRDRFCCERFESKGQITFLVHAWTSSMVASEVIEAFYKYGI